jgi:hypothetical protein
LGAANKFTQENGRVRERAISFEQSKRSGYLHNIIFPSQTIFLAYHMKNFSILRRRRSLLCEALLQIKN